jgi:hypothetical protein
VGTECTDRVFACVADPFMANHTHSEDALFRGIKGSTLLPSCPEHYRCTPLELESSQGMCTCAPGYSGVGCGVPHCDGSVELGFPNGYLRSHALHTESVRTPPDQRVPSLRQETLIFQREGMRLIAHLEGACVRLHIGAPVPFQGACVRLHIFVKVMSAAKALERVLFRI